MKVSVQYLQTSKTGVLRYRHPFPERLRPFINLIEGRSRSELKVSLQARSITEPGAMERFQDAHKSYERLIAQAEKLAGGTFDQLNRNLIRFFADTFLQGHLELDEAARWGDPSPTLPFETRRDYEQDYVECRPMLEAFDTEGLVAYWREWAITFSSSLGYVVDPSTPAFAALCRALGEASCSLWLALDKRIDEIDVETPPKPVPPGPPPSEAQVVPERTFEAILLELIDKPRLGIKEPTKERVRGGLRLLREAVGPLRPSQLTRERVTEFLDLLAQRPAKLPKSDFRLSLPELAARYAERPDIPRLKQKTQEAYIIALGARWKEAQVDGPIPWDVENPFTGRRFRREGRGSSSPKGFSQGELTAYFKLPPFTRGDRPVRGKGDAIYWVPLLLLFTGARPEEVAQLLVSDIRQRESDGRWLIRFTDQGDHPVKGQQSLKTGGLESGQREFPVPQPLLELGLLRYCEYLRAKDELALFPLLRRKGKRSGLFASFGEWMGGYIYNHGVLQRSTGRQPVREFRHTWSTAARNSRIPREAMEYIQGHRAPGGGSSNEGYGERGGLGEHIDDLRLPVNVMSLVVPWSPPTDD